MSTRLFLERRALGKQLPEVQVVALLKDILGILDFITVMALFTEICLVTLLGGNGMDGWF